MRTRFTTAIVLGLSLAVGSTHLCAQATLEDRVKGAIVSKFPQFVEWPPAVVADRSTIDLCVVSGDAIQSVLEELAGGETLGNRRLTVRRVQRDQEVDSCHVLFIRTTAVASNRALLRRAMSQPILTVSDDDEFLDEGGIVRLRQVDGRLRFDVNATAAQKVGLRISSQMLQLAVTVRGGPA